jgi:ABC-2 type transport system permease protein
MKQKGSRRGIMYYIRVSLQILRLSLSKTHTYKAEALANILRSLIVIAPQIVAVYALYQGQNEFVGWKLEETFLILGIFNLINYLSWSSFLINFGRLDEKIIKGEWDFLMLKPISTIFSASFIDLFVYNFFLAISGIGLIVYYLVKSNFVFSWLTVSKSLLALSSAMLIWYSICLISASFSFRKTKNGLMDFSKQILNISRFPLDIWPSLVQVVFYTLIPIGFISTIPAKVITGELSWEAVGASIGISLMFLLIARKIWNVNISKYSSTGS